MNKKGKKIFIIVPLILGIILCWSLFKSKYMLTSTSITISTDKIQKPIRIVQITDLHNSVFGRKNHRLTDLVKKQEPDLILITGDLLNAGEDETDIAVNLISDLHHVAPVYISPGNHEMEYEGKYGTDIVKLYEDAGGVVLDKEYEDISVNGQRIRLGGIYGYCLPGKYLASNEADPRECAFLSDFQNTDLYTVLMCHMPVCWLINDGLNEWNVDCVFAGHVHGGQVVLPFIGGLYAPDMGWFPGRLQGEYTSGDGSCRLILSTGLGSTESVPRFNNTPEIVVADILPR